MNTNKSSYRVSTALVVAFIITVVLMVLAALALGAEMYSVAALPCCILLGMGIGVYIAKWDEYTR